MNFGYIHEIVKDADYLFGDGSIEAEILQPTGQWDAYLPPDELQAALGYETYACGPYGTEHALETLLNRLYGFHDRYSPRYLAKMVGCDLQHGSSPQAVAEFIRNNGNVDDDSWPVLPAINTFEIFYAQPPAQLAVQAGLFLQHYTFQHDYVPNDQTSIKQALMFSPLGMSVYAWNQLPNGLYQAGDGTNDNHWVTVYGYDDVSYHVFDSYDATHKRVDINHRPMVCKRYNISLTPQTTSFFANAIRIIKAWLKLP